MSGRPNHPLVEVAKANVPEDVARALTHLADLTGLSLREVVRVALVEHVHRLGLVPVREALGTTYTHQHEGEDK